MDHLDIHHPPAATEADWQARCGVQKIVQTDRYGCGVACLAMVTGWTYQRAREHFVSQGLGQKRHGRPPFSTSSGEMRMAVATVGLLTLTRRWRGWADLHGLAIVKLRDIRPGERERWHWAVAFRHPEFEVVVFDPHREWPGFIKPPMDTLCTIFEAFQPKGEWLQVEQSFPLAPAVL